MKKIGAKRKAQTLRSRSEERRKKAAAPKAEKSPPPKKEGRVGREKKQRERKPKVRKGEPLDFGKMIRRLKWFSVSLAVLAVATLIGFGGYRLYSGRFFPVENVYVFGAGNLSDREIIGLMGVAEGEDLLWLDEEEVAHRLLSSPWVLDVSIRKEYPDTLNIRITEGRPVAILREPGGDYIVDHGGRKLERLGEGAEFFLPVIVSESAEADRGALRTALELVEAVKRSPLAGEPVRIVNLEGGAEHIALEVDDTLVKIGREGHARKIEKYLELRREIDRRWKTVAYVDLRFANRVFVRPGGEGRKEVRAE